MATLNEVQRKWTDDFLAANGKRGTTGERPVNVSRSDGSDVSGPSIGEGNGNGDVLADSQGVRADTSPHGAVPKLEVKLEKKTKWGVAAFVATLEQGTANAPNDATWKALEQKTSVKLNGFTTKAEAKLLKGEFDFVDLDNLKVTLEMSGGKATVDSKKTLEIDALSITLKAQGVWKETFDRREFTFKVGGEFKVPVAGQLKALVEKRVKAKIAGVMAAHADEIVQAAKIDKVADGLKSLHTEHGKVTNEIAKLRNDQVELTRKGKTLDATAKKRLAELEAKSVEISKQMTVARDKMKEEVGKLSKLKEVTQGLRNKVTGTLEKGIAKLMATRTAQLVGRFLLKAIPIVNIISTIIDVAGLINDIRNLFKNYKRDGAEGSADGDGEGKGSGKGEKGKGTGEGEKGKGPGGDGAKGPTDGPVTHPGQVDKNLPPGSGKPGKKPDASPPKGGKAGGGPITRPDQVPDPKRFANDPRVVLMRDFPNEVVVQWFAFKGDQLVITQKADDWIKQHVGKSTDGLKIKSAGPRVTKQQASGNAAKVTVTFEYSIDQDSHSHSHYLFIHNAGGKFNIARAGGFVLQDAP